MSLAPDTEPEVLFIVAVPRSGSTWLLRLLAHHPRIVGFQFAYFLQSLKAMEEWWLDGLPTHQPSRAVLSLDLSPVSDSVPPRAGRTVDEVVTRESFYDGLRSLTHSVYRQILGAKPAARIVVDHGDRHLEMASFAQKIFPQSRFLHLVRDPRSVYASRLAAVASWSGGFSTNPLEFAEEWVEHCRLARQLGSRTSLVHRVRYEDLLADGVDSLRRLFEWLDVEADSTLVRNIVEACSISRMKEEVAAPAGFVRSGRADSWSDELPSSRVRIVEHIAARDMRQVGYDLAHSGSAGRLSLAQWRLRRRLYTLLSSIFPERRDSPSAAPAWPSR